MFETLTQSQKDILKAILQSQLAVCIRKKAVVDMYAGVNLEQSILMVEKDELERQIKLL